MTNERMGVSVDPERHFRDFDALPVPIKKVFWRAPHDFDVGPTRARLEHGRAVATERVDLIARLSRTRDRLLAATWGPGHPARGTGLFADSARPWRLS